MIDRMNEFEITAYKSDTVNIIKEINTLLNALNIDKKNLVFKLSSRLYVVIDDANFTKRKIEFKIQDRNIMYRFLSKNRIDKGLVMHYIEEKTKWQHINMFPLANNYTIIAVYFKDKIRTDIIYCNNHLRLAVENFWSEQDLNSKCGKGMAYAEIESRAAFNSCLQKDVGNIFNSVGWDLLDYAHSKKQLALFANSQTIFDCGDRERIIKYLTQLFVNAYIMIDMNESNLIY